MKSNLIIQNDKWKPEKLSVERIFCIMGVEMGMEGERQGENVGGKDNYSV